MLGAEGLGPANVMIYIKLFAKQNLFPTFNKYSLVPYSFLSQTWVSLCQLSHHWLSQGDFHIPWLCCGKSSLPGGLQKQHITNNQIISKELLDSKTGLWHTLFSSLLLSRKALWALSTLFSSYSKSNALIVNVTFLHRLSSQNPKILSAQLPGDLEKCVL